MRVFECGSIVYDDSNLSAYDKSISIEVDVLPTHADIPGKYAQIKADLKTGTLYYDYYDLPKEEIDVLKDTKFAHLLNNAEQALKSFQFQGLTLELSGDSKTNLMFAQSQIQADPATQIKWRALNKTYALGEDNSFMLTALNLSDFTTAMVVHVNSVLYWQDTIEALLLNATTIEEVEVMDVEYHG